VHKGDWDATGEKETWGRSQPTTPSGKFELEERKKKHTGRRERLTRGGAVGVSRNWGKRKKKTGSKRKVVTLSEGKWQRGR